jgi:hypothetical protein
MIISRQGTYVVASECYLLGIQSHHDVATLVLSVPFPRPSFNSWANAILLSYHEPGQNARCLGKSATILPSAAIPLLSQASTPASWLYYHTHSKLQLYSSTLSNMYTEYPSMISFSSDSLIHRSPYEID